MELQRREPQRVSSFDGSAGMHLDTAVSSPVMPLPCPLQGPEPTFPGSRCFQRFVPPSPSPTPSLPPSHTHPRTHAAQVLYLLLISSNSSIAVLPTFPQGWSRQFCTLTLVVTPLGTATPVQNATQMSSWDFLCRPSEGGLFPAQDVLPSWFIPSLLLVPSVCRGSALCSPA